MYVVLPPSFHYLVSQPEGDRRSPSLHRWASGQVLGDLCGFPASLALASVCIGSVDEEFASVVTHQPHMGNRLRDDP
jgi:hypothetical protein